jgi:thymidylate synthase
MRSNDCWTGFCIDQFCNSLLHQLVLHELKSIGVEVEMGMYSHSTGSMHAYLDYVDRNMLRDTFNNYNSSDKLAEARLSIPEHINLTNFWEHASEVFAEDLVDHFKQYVVSTY